MRASLRFYQELNVFLARGQRRREFERHCRRAATVEHMIESHVPPAVRERCQRISTCARCRRVYWEGSHWQRMRALADALGLAR